MRRMLSLGMFVVMVVVGCKREPHGAGAQAGSGSSAPTGGTGDAALAVLGDAADPAPVSDVDLLHAIPTRLAVSSVVANPKISPFDLFDGKLDTAWNSKTGQLVGAWIAVRVPPATHVKAFRLTAGFVATGPEGDYFVLNPRIQRVAIWHDGVKLREHELDISSRELQDVPIDAAGGDYKLEVLAVVAGQRKNWRETCVSELQVIGRPPPGMPTGDHDPEVYVGSLDGKPIASTTVELVALDTFADKDAFCATFIAGKPAPCEPWDKPCEQAPERNTCGDSPSRAPTLPRLPAGWTATWFQSKYGNASFTICNLALVAGGATYILPGVGGHDCGEPGRIGGRPPYRKTRHEVRVAEVLGDGGEPELVLVMTTPDDLALAGFTRKGDDAVERLFVCAAGSAGAPRCFATVIGALAHTTESSPDGYDEWLEQQWKHEFELGRGVLAISAASGKPDDADVLAPGRYRLRQAD